MVPSDSCVCISTTQPQSIAQERVDIVWVLSLTSEDIFSSLLLHVVRPPHNKYIFLLSHRYNLEFEYPQTNFRYNYLTAVMIRFKLIWLTRCVHFSYPTPQGLAEHECSRTATTIQRTVETCELQELHSPCGFETGRGEHHKNMLGRASEENQS